MLFSFLSSDKERRHVDKTPVPVTELITEYNEIAKSPDNDLKVIKPNIRIEDLQQIIDQLPKEEQKELHKKLRGKRLDDEPEMTTIEIEDRRLRDYIIKLALTVGLVTVSLVVLLFVAAFIRASNPQDLSAVLKEMVDTVSEIIGVIIDPPNK